MLAINFKMSYFDVILELNILFFRSEKTQGPVLIPISIKDGK